MITERDGEIAFGIHTQIADNEKERRKLFSFNVKLLADMRDGLYKAVLGDENAEFTAYLAQLEVFYTRSKIFTLLRIYDKYIKELGLKYEDIADIPPSRLTDMITIVTKNDINQWLDYARTLISLDFKDMIRKQKGLPFSDDGHKHKMKQYNICTECGIKELV